MLAKGESGAYIADIENVEIGLEDGYESQRLQWPPKAYMVFTLKLKSIRYAKEGKKIEVQ